MWIPKEENSTQLDQFRIISLLCVEAKIFLSTILKRLCTYLEQNRTSVQKGSVSGIPGCLEHNGVVTQKIREAREKKGNLQCCGFIWQMQLAPFHTSWFSSH